MNTNATRVTHCLSCGSNNLCTFLDLGMIPPPNMLLDSNDSALKEPMYPLGMQLCNHCGLMQLTHIVDPDLMFSHYLYVPSTSKTMVDHFDTLAEVASMRASPGDSVLDIGSNDGTLLKAFKVRGMKVMGVDPARNLAEKATESGIPTIAAFFGREIAQEIYQEFGAKKIITGTNVMAHVPDTNSFVSGVKTLLMKKGTFVVEFPYGMEILRGLGFDTIYHEHVFYFTIRPLISLFNRHGLQIYDLQNVPVHGGSLRLFVCHIGDFPVTEAVNTLIRSEQDEEKTLPDVCAHFQEKADTVRTQVLDFLTGQQRLGNCVVGYGAPAKATVLLNYCGIKPPLLCNVVDSVPLKHGKWIPGARIPIKPESDFLGLNPDVALIFPWNFVKEIVGKNKQFIQRGGKFVIAFPSLHYV